LLEYDQCRQGWADMTGVVHLLKESSVPDLKLFQDQRTAGLSSLKKIRIKEPLVQLFQKPLRTCGFHKRTSNELAVIWVVIDQNWVYDVLRIAFQNSKNHPDNHRASVPVSINCPVTLDMILPQQNPTHHFMIPLQTWALYSLYSSTLLTTCNHFGLGS